MTDVKMTPTPVVASKLTDNGYEIVTADPGVYEELFEFYHSNRATPEPAPGNRYVVNKPGVVASTLTQVPSNFVSQLQAAIQPVAEAWSGKKLQRCVVYGIRTYAAGSTLIAHRDMDSNHVITAVINIDQQVMVPWPLYIEGEQGQAPWREVYMTPGDMVLYESNRLNYGHARPLEGTSFACVYIRFALAN
jgi:hypothetical protein